MDNLKVRVLSIDPGSINLGYSFGIVDIKNKSMTIIEANTLSIEKICTPPNGEAVGKLQLIYDNLGIVIRDLLEHYNPDVVVCEAPYMGRFPHAYAVLVVCTQTIRAAVNFFDFTIDFTLVEPSTVKKRVGVKGNSGDKSAIMKALKTIKPLTLPENYEQLDEHAVDSIAIGYSEFYDVLED